jgi:tetratricopeptide (TPR) repeat protein
MNPAVDNSGDHQDPSDDARSGPSTGAGLPRQQGWMWWALGVAGLFLTAVLVSFAAAWWQTEPRPVAAVSLDQGIEGDDAAEPAPPADHSKTAGQGRIAYGFPTDLTATELPGRRSAKSGGKVGKPVERNASPSPPRGQPDAPKSPPPSPPPEPEIKKQPVPNPTQLAEAEKLIREVHKANYARKKPAEIQAFAAKLLEEGIETKDKPATQYVLLREAIDLAAGSGDLLLAMRGVDELEYRYIVDGLETRIAVLTGASQVQQLPPTMRAITEMALALAEDQVEADQYAAAIRLLTIASAAVRKANSIALQNRVAAASKQVDELTQEYATAKPAIDALHRNPGNAEASLKVGRFIAFFKGNWGAGLPHLARSSDAQVRAAATKDLAGPEEAAAQVAVADAWWDLADAERGTAKTQLLLHAKEWYEQAAAKLSGFSKTQVDKRLKDINVATGQDKAADRSVPTAPKDSYEYQIAMGRSCYRQGNYARAQAFFAEALRLKPDDRRAAVYLRQAKFQKHLTAGYAFANNGLFDEAIRELQLALEEKPNDPAAVNTLNQVLQLQKGGAQGKGKGKGS